MELQPLIFMESDKIASIDRVIEILDQIIDECEQNEDPRGYFASLYKKVTVKVKEGIVRGRRGGDRLEACCSCIES